MIGKRKDRGGGGARKVFSFFPFLIPQRLTWRSNMAVYYGGRKVVTLTRPNKTPALQATVIAAKRTSADE